MNQENSQKLDNSISLDFDVLSFINFISTNKSLLFKFILAFAFISVVYNFMFRPIIYTSTIKIYPVDSASESVVPQSLTRMISGGLAGGAGTKDTKNVSIITSRQFMDSFIEKRDLAKYLIAVDEYDSGSKTLVFKKKFFDIETQRVKDEFLNYEQLYRLMRKRLSVKTFLESDMVEISIRFISPFAASDIANWLVEDLNTFLADKEVNKSQRNIDFLNTTINPAQGNYIDLSNLYNSLKLQEIKKLMLAKSSEEFAYEIIDPAYPVMVKTSPKRGRDTVLGVILGGIFGMIYLILLRVIQVYKLRYQNN